MRILRIGVIVVIISLFSSNLWGNDIGWWGYSVGETSLGPCIDEGANYLFHLSFVNFRISPYKSSPYPRFGFSTSLIEVYGLGGESKKHGKWRESVLPIYLHFIPHMKIKEMKVQPNELKRDRNWGRDLYYFHPTNKTECIQVVKKFIDISLGGSIWADIKSKAPDDLVSFEAGEKGMSRKSWYVKGGIKLGYFGIFRDPFGIWVGALLPLAIEGGVLITPYLDNPKIQIYPYLALELTFIGTFQGFFRVFD